MSVPDLIPIAHEPDYATSTIGAYRDGQFLASTIYAFPEGAELREDWPEHKRMYAYLHRFDHDGHHTGSDVWCAGTYAELHAPDNPAARAERRLAEWLDALPERVYGDIAIRPFRFEVNGVTFGLVLENHETEDGPEPDSAELYPDGLGFHSPWDGLYST